MLRSVLTVLSAAAMLAGCGDGAQPVSPTPTDTRLDVTVRPQGADGPRQHRVVTRAPEGITPEDFEPVPPDVACIQVYGGPATARVTGRLDGTPIDARFDRTNGCQIRRWDRVAALLGRVDGPASP